MTKSEMGADKMLEMAVRCYAKDGFLHRETNVDIAEHFARVSFNRGLEAGAKVAEGFPIGWKIDGPMVAPEILIAAAIRSLKTREGE